MHYSIVLVVRFPIWLERQFIVNEDEIWDPSLKLHCKIQSRESNRDRFLNSVDMFEWPFTEILGRSLSVSFSFFFSCHHAFVLTITLAIPLFPSQVKWLLHVPWTVNGFSISWKFTVLEASIPHASSFLTLINTWLVKRIRISFTSFKCWNKTRYHNNKQNPWQISRHPITKNRRK